MRKKFGWILIIMFILFSLLPIYYYTETIPVTHYSQSLGLPSVVMEERISQTWFLLVTPLDILWTAPL